ncbi:type II secretion system F family protein [Bacillus marinisedimentorum]|uniref:type II secretion system F family protein n=1 Tax=Bacillus marinisedimentorum TaxID=1821260 RepID=UPI000871C505|nr:type II secretion system F family protein [Bacillus marinisedimentorum]
MGYFRFEGREKSGKKRKGKIEADTRREAVLKLREKNIAVLEISQVPETIWNKEITVGRQVKLRDFVIFLRQFSTLLKAGVTVVNATRILSEQTESKTLKKALIHIEDELREGNPLSAACSKHPKVFPPLFFNMMRAGEAGGNMDETLEQLADHFEKMHRIRQKVISALTYPAVVGTLAVAVVVFLLIAIVPVFVDMFAGFGAELPAITQVVLNASMFMQRFWWLFVLLFVLAYAAIHFIRRDKEMKYYLDYAVLKMPIFGKMLQKAALARMARTLSSLFASSVPILQALSIVERVVGNEVIARVLNRGRESLESGQSLAAPMKEHWVFPPLVTQMIAIGEETGSLDAMLAKVADFYEAEVETATDRLKAVIEPLMIVILAALVGIIVLAIIVPMFDIFNQIG